MTSKSILKQIKKEANPVRAKHSERYFKTGPGEYGEGDIFLGLSNPATHLIAKKNIAANLNELEELLDSPFHEARHCALLILVIQFKKADETEKKKLVKFYLKKKKRVNNWDLVDSSAHKILGQYCFENNDTKIMEKLLRSKNMWDRRMAMLSTWPFIKNGQLNIAYDYTRELLTDKEDLMHKVVGWMLREVGKRNEKSLIQFIEKHGNQMPRTTLRYAIERIEPNLRKKLLLKTRV